MPKTHKDRLRLRNELIETEARRRDKGFSFPLSATSLGMDKVQIARVRRLTLSDDPEAIRQIPMHLRSVVNEGLAYIEQEQKKIDEQGGGSTETLEDRGVNARRFLPAADSFCFATFLDPKLFLTELELNKELQDNPDGEEDVLLVSQIAAEDRMAWFWACFDADSKAAKSLKLFRERTSIDVPYRAAGGDDGRETFEDTEAPQGSQHESIAILPRG